jgi:hypothetical protein
VELIQAKDRRIVAIHAAAFDAGGFFRAEN